MRQLTPEERAAQEDQKRDFLARWILDLPTPEKQWQYLNQIREHNSSAAVQDITARMRRIDPVKGERLEKFKRSRHERGGES